MTTCRMNHLAPNGSSFGVPALLIGLGGTGVNAARLIKQRINSTAAHNSDVYQFLSIDTDPCPPSPVQERIFSRELAYIGAYDLAEIMRCPLRYSKVAKWWPQNQKRIIGRLSLYAMWHKFTEKFESQMEAINDIPAKEELEKQHVTRDPSGRVKVYIITSLCGGTGSGIFLDVVYKVRALLGQNADDVGILLMPSCFRFEMQNRLQKRGMQANVYAALMELDHWPINMPFISGLQGNLIAGYPTRLTCNFNLVVLIDAFRSMEVNKDGLYYFSHLPDFGLNIIGELAEIGDRLMFVPISKNITITCRPREKLCLSSSTNLIKRTIATVTNSEQGPDRIGNLTSLADAEDAFTYTPTDSCVYTLVAAGGLTSTVSAQRWQLSPAEHQTHCTWNHVLSQTGDHVVPRTYRSSVSAGSELADDQYSSFRWQCYMISSDSLRSRSADRLGRLSPLDRKHDCFAAILHRAGRNLCGRPPLETVHLGDWPQQIGGSAQWSVDSGSRGDRPRQSPRLAWTYREINFKVIDREGGMNDVQCAIPRIHMRHCRRHFHSKQSRLWPTPAGMLILVRHMDTSSGLSGLVG